MMGEKLGQVGFGVLGQIFAGHLLKANGSLVGYDADPERLQRAVSQGVASADSPRGVAERSDAIVLALPSPEAVRSVMLGDAGILRGARSGLLVLDTSTGDPFLCREIYQLAQGHGVRYLEAPVSGGQPRGAGTDGARAGNMTFMVGGDEDAFERAKPLMALLGKHWFHVGPAGNGNTVKLISNLINGLNNLVAAEGLVLGVAAGIPWDKLLEVFRQTDAKSFQMTDYMEPRMRRKDFDPGFSIDLMYKDHRLAGELAQKLGVPVVFNQLALQVYQVLRATGRGQKDYADAINLLAEWAGVDIYQPREPLF